VERVEYIKEMQRNIGWLKMQKYLAVRNIWVINFRGRELYASKMSVLSHIGTLNDKEVVVANQRGIRLILSKGDLLTIGSGEGVEDE